MTLVEIRKRVASYINYVDSSGDLESNADISSTDIDNWINDRYREDLVPRYADLRKEYYMRESTADNYAATGTVDASSTGSTLVTTTSIFTSNMVDARVYNTTDSEGAKITAYTSGTTVTLDTTIGDTWDGDTVYVFTGIYTFGGDANDVLRPDWVGVKYSSTDRDYRRAITGEYRDLFEYEKGRNKDDLFDQDDPRYWFDTVNISGTPTSAIIIRPIDWTEALDDAIYMRYLEIPTALSGDNDVPRLPLGTHKALVFGATADALLKLERFDEANQFEQRYQLAKGQLLRYHVSERKQRKVNFMRQNLRFYRRNR